MYYIKQNDSLDKNLPLSVFNYLFGNTNDDKTNDKNAPFLAQLPPPQALVPLSPHCEWVLIPFGHHKGSDSTESQALMARHNLSQSYT
jgi:hypothetical protein